MRLGARSEVFNARTPAACVWPIPSESGTNSELRGARRPGQIQIARRTVRRNVVLFVEQIFDVECDIEAFAFVKCRDIGRDIARQSDELARRGEAFADLIRPAADAEAPPSLRTSQRFALCRGTKLGRLPCSGTPSSELVERVISASRYA